MKTKLELKQQICNAEKKGSFSWRKSLRVRFMKLASSLLLKKRKSYPSRRNLKKNAFNWKQTRKKQLKRLPTPKRKPS